MEQLRVCEGCGLSLPLAEFRRRARANRHGGWARRCRECELSRQAEKLFLALAEIRAAREARENLHRARREAAQAIAK